MVKGDKRTWKAKFFAKLERCINEYSKIIVVGADNVRSSQMQQIRIALRGKAEILMGKNTMIRKAIRGHLETHPQLEAILPFVKNNVGFVFTKADLSITRDLVLSNKVKAPAKAGIVAPCDVSVPGGNTGMGPEKTSFFQALNINTKITKGTIEILADVHLIKTGDRVGPSEAALLNMLGISPFSYGLSVLNVYDNGAVYSPEVLDISTTDILNRFLAGVQKVASVSLAIGYPTVASVPHSIINGFKNVLSVAVATGIEFPAAAKAKAYLANPGAFAVAAPVAAAPAAAAPAAKAAPKVEEKEEEEADMSMSLFD